MNPVLLLSLLATLVNFVEGSFFKNLRIRILPAGNEKETVKTEPNTPMSSGRSEAASSLMTKPNRSPNNFFHHRKTNNRKISPNGNELLELENVPFSFKVKEKFKVSNKTRLQTFFADQFKISKGFDSLDEETAAALLEIEDYMSNLRSIESINELYRMHLAQNFRTQYTVSSGIFSFSDEIYQELTEVKDLKEFLRVLIKYYKVCFRNEFLDKILVAVMKSRLFSVEELAAVAGIGLGNLFALACSNSDINAAKNILNCDKPFPKDVIFVDVEEAFSLGNDDFVEEIVEFIGDKYGEIEKERYDSMISEIKKRKEEE